MNTALSLNSCLWLVLSCATQCKWPCSVCVCFLFLFTFYGLCHCFLNRVSGPRHVCWPIKGITIRGTFIIQLIDYCEYWRTCVSFFPSSDQVAGYIYGPKQPIIWASTVECHSCDDEGVAMRHRESEKKNKLKLKCIYHHSRKIFTILHPVTLILKSHHQLLLHINFIASLTIVHFNSQWWKCSFHLIYTRWLLGFPLFLFNQLSHWNNSNVEMWISFIPSNYEDWIGQISFYSYNNNKMSIGQSN